MSLLERSRTKTGQHRSLLELIPDTNNAVLKASEFNSEEVTT